MTQNPYRALPSIDALLAEPRLRADDPALVSAIARETLATELDIEASVDVSGATAARPVGDGSSLLVDLEKL